MLMEEFENWKTHQKLENLDDERRSFDDFFQHKYFGRSFMEMVTELACELYEAQVCIEGILQDQEESYA